MAYRSIYDQNANLGIGTEGMGPYDDIKALETDLLAEQDASLVGTGTDGVSAEGGGGASPTSALAVMSLAGNILEGQKDNFSENYYSVGQNTDKFQTKELTDSLSQAGGIGQLFGSAITNIEARTDLIKSEFESGDFWGGMGEVASNLGMGIGNPFNLENAEQDAMDKHMRYPEKPTSPPPIPGLATGGRMNYASGGQPDIKEVKGAKGIDNVPIDDQLNNAGDSGKRIQGFAQDGEMIVDGYIFSKELGFAQDVKKELRKFNYDDMTGEIDNGDEPALNAFNSNVAKIRQQNDSLRQAVQRDEQGFAKKDTKGNYVILDPNIIDEVSKKRKYSSKKLANILGETINTERKKELARSLPSMATGEYMEISNQEGLAGYASGGVPNYADNSKWTVKNVQSVIDKWSGGESPIQAEWILEYADKYGVPVELALTQGALESNFGTAGRGSKSFNPYNVGNFTAGDTQTYEDSVSSGNTNIMGDWETGVEEYFKLIHKDYKPESGNWSDLFNPDHGFVRREQRDRYATDENYETKAISVMDSISNVAGVPIDPKELSPYVQDEIASHTTLNEHEVTAKGNANIFKKKQIDDMNITNNSKSDVTLASNPNSMIETPSFSSGMSKRREARLQKKYDQVTEDVVGELPLYADAGFATGGDAMRMIGMLAPAAFNIGYGLTEDPKTLDAMPYMTSTIRDPEPIDINPELRDIEKAGASARASGRARSSMAGQIASQSAEQAAISKVHRDKQAIDLNADLQAEQINAGIRERNSNIKFQVDKHNIGAEEAIQQYINTGMGQIGEVAQVMGTESLQREQLDVMKGYYDGMNDMGQKELDLMQTQIDNEAAYQQKRLDMYETSLETPDPGDDIDPNDSGFGDPTGPTPSSMSQPGKDGTVPADYIPTTLTNTGVPGTRLSGATKEEVNAAMETDNQRRLELLNEAGAEDALLYGEEYVPIESTEDLSDYQWDLLVDQGLAQQTDPKHWGDKKGYRMSGDATSLADQHDNLDRLGINGVIETTGIETFDEVPTANSMISINKEGDATFNDPQLALEFDQWAADNKDYTDNSSLKQQDMLEFAASKGFPVRALDDNGKPTYYNYESVGSKAGYNKTAKGQFGGRYTKNTKGTPTEGFVTKGKDLGKTIGTGTIVYRGDNGWENMRMSGKIPKGKIAVISPTGYVTLISKQSAVPKGWKKVVGAGGRITEKRLKELNY